MKTKQLILGVITILTLFCCNTQNKKSNQTDFETVKVGYLNMVSSLTHFVALDKDYYSEQKINVDANQIKTSNLIAQELVAGHIDVGIELAITPLIKHLEVSPNTVKIFSISEITIENGFDAILVKPNSDIKNLKDLSGKKVGGFPGTTAKVSFLQLFTQKYPELEAPKFIPLTPNLHIQSLESGDIDALFAYEPVLSTGKVKLSFRQIYPSIYGSQFSPSPIGVGAVNQKWFTENNELASRFLKAIDKSLDFISSNPVEAKQILAKATGIDLDIAQNMNTLPLSKSNEINLENLDKYLALLVDLKEISELPLATDICIKQ